MPTYEYECEACGHAFELLQRMSDPAVRKCPKCRKLRVRRLISGGAGVIFRGSGFYETDYKRNRRGAEAASAVGDGPGSDGASKDAGSDPAPSKADGKQDSRSHAKPDSKASGAGSKADSAAKSGKHRSGGGSKPSKP